MIQMTRDEYNKKYGTQPSLVQPIRMTRDQYQQKYGKAPQIGEAPRKRGEYRNTLSSGDYLKGTAGNILPSAGKTLWGLGESIVNAANPDLSKNTIANMSRLGMGVVQKLDPTEGKIISKATQVLNPAKVYDQYVGASTDYQPQAEAVGKFYKDRYGGVENIKKSLYEDPTGVALDAATVLSGAGGLVKGAGTLTKSARIAQIGRGLETAGELTNPLSLVGKGIGKVGSVLKPKAAGLMEGVAEGYATSGLGDPQLIKDIQGVTGKKTSQIMKEYNLFDRSPASVDKAIEGIDSVMSSKIKGAPDAKVLDILKQFDAKIAQLKSESEFSASARGQLDELLQRRGDFVDYIKKNDFPESIPAGQVREMKQKVGGDVKNFSPDATKSIQTASAKDVYDIYKDKLNELAGTKQLGLDESGLIKLKEIFKNAAARGQSRQAMGLKDFVAAGAGGTLGGVPGALGGIALRQFLDSPKGVQIVTELLQKGAGRIRNAKLPNTNIFSKLVKGAQINRMVNPK